MREETVRYFTENEEKLVSLLIQTGTKKSIAQILVFLARTPRATCRDIERGCDMRQSEVSLAAKELKVRGWVEMHNWATGRSPPARIYELARPFGDILKDIEDEKRAELNDKLDRIGKIREYIRE